MKKNLIFLLIEPGYYEPKNFGIRLETDIEVVRANTEVRKPIFYKYSIQFVCLLFKYASNYLTFSAQTLIPFDAALIDVELLEKDQVI